MASSNCGGCGSPLEEWEIGVCEGCSVADQTDEEKGNLDALSRIAGKISADYRNAAEEFAECSSSQVLATRATGLFSRLEIRTQDLLDRMKQIVKSMQPVDQERVAKKGRIATFLSALDIATREEDQVERALYFMLRQHADSLPELDHYFHKAFRQVDVTGSSDADVAIWLLLGKCKVFWKLFESHRVDRENA